MRKLWIAGTLALLVGAGTLGTLPAQASTSGRRNTAIALGAAAIYELVRGDTTAGIALGAGAAYGYKRYEDEKRYEDRDYRYWDRRGSRHYDGGSRYSDGGYRPVSRYDYRTSGDRYSRYDRSGRYDGCDRRSR